jgi:hypothetical protein
MNCDKRVQIGINPRSLYKRGRVSFSRDFAPSNGSRSSCCAKLVPLEISGASIDRAHSCYPSSSAAMIAGLEKNKRCGLCPECRIATNADAKPDPLVLRHIGILFCYSALNFDGASD